MVNEHTREILLTSFIICPIPDLWPAGTQAQNNDRRLSLTDLRIWHRAPTSIIYRLQSHPSLLRTVLRSAYLKVSAFLTSVSQGKVSSTKAILCLPCTDRSRKTRSGLCACIMTSAGIDLSPVACSPSKSQYSSTLLLAHKGRLQATRDVIQDQIVPPGQPSLVQCVFTMDQNLEQHLLHHVPTELAID
jgi:hypothetical protein